MEVELKKVGLRLINVNIKDITDESGYIDALGKEASARAINEAKVSVAEREKDGEIGAAEAEREEEFKWPVPKLPPPGKIYPELKWLNPTLPDVNRKRKQKELLLLQRK